MSGRVLPIIIIDCPGGSLFFRRQRGHFTGSQGEQVNTGCLFQNLAGVKGLRHIASGTYRPVICQQYGVAVSQGDYGVFSQFRTAAGGVTSQLYLSAEVGDLFIKDRRDVQSGHVDGSPALT